MFLFYRVKLFQICSVIEEQQKEINVTWTGCMLGCMWLGGVGFACFRLRWVAPALAPRLPPEPRGDCSTELGVSGAWDIMPGATWTPVFIWLQ